MSSQKPLNEEEIIRLLWRTFGKSSSSKSGKDPFNDDVAWKVIPDRWKKKGIRAQRMFISKSDMLVSSTDVPKGMAPRQIASKSITACVSDFASKGVKPLYCLLSLGLPKSFAKWNKVLELGRGFRDACRLYGVQILAGDVNATEYDLVIDCSMYGLANSIVKRSSARPGDFVGVSGKFGLQSAGLRLLQGVAKTSDRGFERAAKNSVLNPRARLDLGLSISKLLTSSIDSSDGLALSLYHIAESSNVNIEINKIPLAEGITYFAEENELDPTALALFGGEEYELVSTYSPETIPREKAEKLGIMKIGRVTPLTGRTPRVFMTPTGRGKTEIIPRRGWLHFASSSC